MIREVVYKFVEVVESNCHKRLSSGSKLLTYVLYSVREVIY